MTETAFAEAPRIDGKPYPGLRAFKREEYHLFFGRENCLNQMIDSLLNDQFLAVLGPSGNGKSSLVRAAFLQELRMGLAGEEGIDWQFADIKHPGLSEPFTELARALLKSRPAAQIAGSNPASIDVQALADRLRSRSYSLNSWFKEEGNVAPGHHLIVLVDQFEELFRFHRRREKGLFTRQDVADFIDLLLATLQLNEAGSSPRKVFIVITMRAEYLHLCTSFKGLAERLSRDAVIPPRMTYDQCREAIVGPIRVLNRMNPDRLIKIEDELIGDLLRDLTAMAPFDQGDDEIDQTELLGRQADQLPLLQHVLNLMWRQAPRATDEGVTLTTLTRKAYLEEFGPLKKSLDRRGDDLMREHFASKDDAQLVERIFRALVDGPEVSLAVRRPCTITDLCRETNPGWRMESGTPDAPGWDEAHERRVRAIVDVFRHEDVCFLTPFLFPDDESSREVRPDEKIAISHEALIRQWEALRIWYEREIEDRQQWRHIAELLDRDDQSEGRLERILHLIDQWRGRKHDKLLWRGITLKDINTWWNGPIGQSNAEERDGLEEGGEPERTKPPAMPFPGWVERYARRRKDYTSGLGEREYFDGARVLAESQDRERLRRGAGMALSLTTLLLAATGICFWLYFSISASEAREKAKFALSRAQVERQNAKEAIKSALEASKYAQTSAEFAVRAANIARNRAEQAQKSIELAETRKVAAIVAIRRAEVQERHSVEAVNFAKLPVMVEVVRYINEGKVQDEWGSRDAYIKMSNVVEKMRAAHGRFSKEEMAIIADAHLTAVTNAMSQLDPEFMSEVLKNARTTVSDTSPHAVTEEGIRFRLSLAREKMWAGKFADALQDYRGVAEDLKSAAVDMDRFHTLAVIGVSEANEGLGKIVSPEEGACHQPFMGTKKATVPTFSQIRQVVSDARCFQLRVRLANAADSSEAYEQSSAWLRSLPAAFKFDPRYQRLFVELNMERGDRLTKDVGVSATNNPDLQPDQAYRMAATTSLEPFFSTFGTDRIIDYQHSRDEDGPDTPFRKAALVDVWNFMRSRVRERYAFGLSLAAMDASGRNEARTGENEARTGMLVQRGDLLIMPAALAGRYLINEVESRHSEGRSFIDIPGYAEEMRQLLRDGAATAPLIFENRIKDPHFVPGASMAESVTASLSFARDAIRFEKMYAPFDIEELQEGSDSSEMALDVPAPTRSLEAVYHSISALTALIRAREKGRFDAAFLDYTPGLSVPLTVANGADTSSTPALVKLGRLVSTARLVCEQDPRLNKTLCAATKQLQDDVFSRIKSVEANNQVVEGEVWTDNNGIALGGMDVVQCRDGFKLDSSGLGLYIKRNRDKLNADFPEITRNESKVTDAYRCFATPGNMVYSFERQGITWLFTTPSNRERFRESPRAFMPLGRGLELSGIVTGKRSDSIDKLYSNKRLNFYGGIVGKWMFIINQTADFDSPE